MKQKYLRADELAELFRDMAEFAETDEARQGLLAAARTVDELPGVWLEEGTAAGETETNVRGGVQRFSGPGMTSDSGTGRDTPIPRHSEPCRISADVGGTDERAEGGCLPADESEGKENE